MAWQFYATTQIEAPITVEDGALTFEKIKSYVTVQYNGNEQMSKGKKTHR